MQDHRHAMDELGYLNSPLPSHLGNDDTGKLDRRPKLLFLAWGFPPSTSSSRVRTWNIAKYLARLGWDVTVVTPKPSLWRCASDDEEITKILRQKGMHRLLTDHRWRLLLSENIKTQTGPFAAFVGKICRKAARMLDIDNAVGWVESAEKACSGLTREDVDVIFATGTPFSAFTIARRLSARLGRPYVLDYRDPWTDNPHRERPLHSGTVKKEAKLLADCSAVTVVSPSWGCLLNRRFGINGKLSIVTNGYDPEELVRVKPCEFGHHAIVYTGTFYPPKRVISPVMAALRLLKAWRFDRKTEWYFHYYGPEDEHVRKEADRYDVTDKVILHGNVRRDLVLSATRGARIAVVIASVGREQTLAERGIVTGKIFEAIGLGTPVLLIAPPENDAANIIEEHGLGQRLDGTDIKGIAHFLSEQGWCRGTNGKPPISYAWPSIATKLDSILRKASSPEPVCSGSDTTRVVAMRLSD